MVNFTIANPKDDNNRMAGDAVEALEQGDLVTVSANGNIVTADAANGLSGQAVGALLTPVIDPDDPKYGSLEYVQNQLKEETNVLLGEDDRALAIQYGVLIEDEDGDGSLTPGEPVYLDEGGGVTQDTSAFASGSVEQIVGFAESENAFLLNVQFTNDVVA